MNRYADVASSLTLLSLLLSGCCQPGVPCQGSGGGFGPSNGEVIAVIAGAAGVGVITVGTVVAVNHSHHVLKGCVSTGANGLQLESDSNKKTYSLAGATADVKAGEIVRVHGSKVKKHKDNHGNQEFLVKKVMKDYGPCKVLTAATSTSATTTTKN